MIHVLQITDTHLFADPAGELYGVNTRQSLMSVLQHKNINAIESDILLLTGDLSHDETEASYDVLNSLIEPLGIPTYCLPGNHDAPAYMEKRLANTTKNGIIHAVHKDWLFVLLDSSVPGAVEGYVKEDVLHKLDELLQRVNSGNCSGAKHVLVAVHHNPVKVNSAWMDRIGVQNGEALFNVLCKYNSVKVVICGHIHQELETQVNDIVVYGTPSSCFQFKPLTSEAQIDDKPHGYRLLKLHSNGKIESRVYWVET
ncbi:MAG: phosphodiesterase [Gammaproteobacteria bacterium]|nr:phosphodiesterase [Gammaproteobacteria bacterium]